MGIVGQFVVMVYVYTEAVILAPVRFIRFWF